MPRWAWILLGWPATWAAFGVADRVFPAVEYAPFTDNDRPLIVFLVGVLALMVYPAFMLCVAGRFLWRRWMGTPSWALIVLGWPAAAAVSMGIGWLLPLGACASSDPFCDPPDITMLISFLLLALIFIVYPALMLYTAGRLLWQHLSAHFNQS